MDNPTPTVPPASSRRLMIRANFGTPIDYYKAGTMRDVPEPLATEAVAGGLAEELIQATKQPSAEKPDVPPADPEADATDTTDPATTAEATKKPPAREKGKK